MAKKKRVAIVIVVVILGVIGLVLLGCGGLVWWGGGAFLKEYNKVQEAFILDACYEMSDTDNYNQEDYEEIFSDNFKSSISYEESKDIINKIIPKGGCEDLEIKNFIDMIKKGLAFEISVSTNDGTTVNLTYSTENGRVILHLVQINGEWKIDDISRR